MLFVKLFVCLGLIATFCCGANGIKNFSENDIPELDYLDTSVDPCLNFYNFTCGHFGDFHPRPSDLKVLDQFTLLEDKLVELGKEILSVPQRDEDPESVKKAKWAYESCISTVLSNYEIAPELQIVKEFGGMPLLSTSNKSFEFSWKDIGRLVGEYGVPLIFTFTAGQLSQNESVIRISSDKLTNPSLFRPNFVRKYEDVIENSFKSFATKRTTRSTKVYPFDTFLQTLAKNLLQYTNPTKSDEEVVSELNNMANFMRSLYSVERKVQIAEILPLETQTTIAELQEWTDKQFKGDGVINWIEHLENVLKLSGVTINNNTKLYLENISYIYGALNLVKQTDSNIVKNFALLRVFLYQAPDSDNNTRKAFEDYYQALGLKLYSRNEYCARKILDVVDTASLSYAVAHDYERYHYDINKISKAGNLVDNIRSSFGETLQSVDWMDDKSRDAALKKSENMLLLLGYPDFVDNASKLDAFYKNLHICKFDNYGNTKNLRAFKQAYQFTQLQSDRYFWGKSVFDSNAYYNRPNNKIVIPLSMLNPPFFYGDLAVLDYSRIGSIIGHEITHGFDVNGKNYNEDGLLISWWTNNTLEAFTDKAQCFEDQYSNYYVPEINKNLNGSYSINENLADNGGVRQAYKAFKKVIQEEEIQATGIYTLEQLFFISYGTMWCSEESNTALSQLVQTVNGYPPKRFRVIGSLSNMKEFSEAFNCPVNTYMNPENKCLLW